MCNCKNNSIMLFLHKQTKKSSLPHFHLEKTIAAIFHPGFTDSLLQTDKYSSSHPAVITVGGSVLLFRNHNCLPVNLTYQTLSAEALSHPLQFSFGCLPPPVCPPEGNKDKRIDQTRLTHTPQITKKSVISYIVGILRKPCNSMYSALQAV